jgi:hypothetical protein
MHGCSTNLDFPLMCGQKKAIGFAVMTKSSERNTFLEGNSNTNSYLVNINFLKEDNLSERFQKAVSRLLTFIPKKKEAF